MNEIDDPMHQLLDEFGNEVSWNIDTEGSHSDTVEDWYERLAVTSD